MNFINIILLGFLQGLTEFFPISSSGHLMIGKILLGINSYGSSVDIVLHLGTLLSILVFWKKDLKIEIRDFKRGDRKLFFTIFVACLPAIFVGFFLNDKIENYFFNIDYENSFPNFLIFNYIAMFFFIFITKYFHKNNKTDIIYIHAFIIGLMQCIAFMPGISRSGITILAALMLGYSFRKAIKFSFYLAIPILMFAGFKLLLDNFNTFTFDMYLSSILALGFVASFIFGYIILHFLDVIIKNKKFWLFSFYCLLISILLLVYNYGF